MNLSVSALDHVQKITQWKMKVSVMGRNAAVLAMKLGVILKVLILFYLLLLRSLIDLKSVHGPLYLTTFCHCIIHCMYNVNEQIFVCY